MNQRKNKYSLFHIGLLLFFLGYFLAIYFLLYHPNGLNPFQYNIYFFSNAIGSLCKRYITEVGPYALLFYLIYYSSQKWLRVFWVMIFLVLFWINMGMMLFYFMTRSNFQYYILQAFKWSVVPTFLDIKLSIIMVMLVGILSAFLYLLFKSKLNQSQSKPNYLLIALIGVVTVMTYVIPVYYFPHLSLTKTDILKKKYFRNIELEYPGLNTFFNECYWYYNPPKIKKIPLTTEDNKAIESNHLNEKIIQNSPFQPKKIVLIVLESFNQSFMSYYNSEIPETTPFVDSLIEKYPHIDDFYPSGPYTLQGVSSLLCSHTNLYETNSAIEHVCMPQLLSQNSYSPEFIRSGSRYYMGENLIFNKFGYQKIRGTEDFNIEFPDFKKNRPDLYNTWGFSDNFTYDDAIKRLKQSSKEEKLFLTLLPHDTHAPGGRCYAPKTDDDLENPILYSMHCSDNYLKDFFANLEKNELLNENTLILITSDQLYPACTTIAGDKCDNSFAFQLGKIPLIAITKSDFSFVSQQGSHVDIAPTILDLLNIPIPDYYMGKSLISDPYTFPLGRDGRIGYIMANSQYYPFALFDSEALSNNKEFMIYVDPNNVESLNNQLNKQFDKQYDNSNYYTKWYKGHF